MEHDKLKTFNIVGASFELKEDAEMGYLVHFAAPFTGGDESIVPKGTTFIVNGPMRDDAFYISLEAGDNIKVNDELTKLMGAMAEKVKRGAYGKLFSRLQGFSFFITEEQIRTLPLKFACGVKERLLDCIMYQKWSRNKCLVAMGRPKEYLDVPDDYSHEL